MSNLMRMRVICSILIAACFLASITTFFLVKKYYLAYNLLKLNPLEEKSSEIINSSHSEKSNGIWLIGDSRIARWNTELFSSFGPGVNNLGIEGQTTSQVLLRLRYNLETDNPELVFLEAGINDLKIIGLNKKLAASIKEDCYNNIKAITNLCQKKNVIIVVINIFPTGKIDFMRRFVWNSSVESAIVETNERLRLYCNSENIPYFDAYHFLAGNGSSVERKYQDDFLHINENAYTDLSKALIDELKRNYNIGLTSTKNIME
jgi:lysophospholipase L1-like esterase